MSDNREKKTTIGGQALIEGILMRGPKKTSIVVRKPDGELEIKNEDIGTSSHGSFAKLPFVRGCVTLFDSMKYGVSALEYSASFFEEEEGYRPGKFDLWMERTFGKKGSEKLITTIAIAFGIAIPILLFFMLPAYISGVVKLETGLLRSLLEGVVRIAIFMLFIIVTSKQRDIKRTYMYHGAEHKTIFCYEKGLELTVENCRGQSRFHPRCGTSFMFVVVMVSILVSLFFSPPNVWARMALRLLTVPLVVGISYEVTRFLGRYDNLLSKIVRAPGLFMQRFTTVEPDDSMLEVAIVALKEVLPAGENEDVW